ncbi:MULTISPECIES: hypothetical protein [Thalassospira]|uniref:hypothetical protein n=1 Tax=Thalassospira TaxID=168934 RepID=UPI000C63BD7F|nr:MULTISPECIES: hypothetical protein [Thalassospira]MAB32219.1 hypothetical protein [Thalassospira sp.]HBS22719.1 hypothetical protein [Thalassospira sp.]|tara:strand:+ start:246 stop:842 length:597 start_codon:yes stop_codon:yes gene_type:complete
MKYVKPLNETDPDAPYIDGDASQDIEGSEVPAAAIEDPMREIVNAITYFLGTTENPLPADDADLQQLRKAIQQAVIDGTANGLFRNVSATLTAGFNTEFIDLTVAGGVASFDPTARSRFKHTLTGAIVIANPVTVPNAGPAMIKLTQDAAGNRAVDWGTKYRKVGDVNYEANSVSLCHLQYDSADDVIDVVITHRPEA